MTSQSIDPKDKRILNHFRSLMEKKKNEYKFSNLWIEGEEYRKACQEAYDETILFLAKHWKMKCIEIKNAINRAKKKPVKYNSRTELGVHTRPL